jgi:hypothetical protein
MSLRHDEPNFLLRVAMGEVEGWQQFRKFGLNDDVPATGSEEMWPTGTARVLPAAAAVCVVSSGSAEDDPDEATPPGTGAWTITIEGLDANHLEVSETLTLAGTANATTTQTFLRVNRAYVATAGTNKSNVGILTGTVSGDIQFTIEANEGQTHQTNYTVPANKTLLVTSLTVGVGRMAGNTDLHIDSQVRLDGVSADAGWRSVSVLYIYNGAIRQNDGTVTLVPSKSEIRQRITSNVATHYQRRIQAGSQADRRVAYVYRRETSGESQAA